MSDLSDFVSISSPVQERPVSTSPATSGQHTTTDVTAKIHLEGNQTDSITQQAEKDLAMAKAEFDLLDATIEPSFLLDTTIGADILNDANTGGLINFESVSQVESISISCKPLEQPPLEFLIDDKSSSELLPKSSQEQKIFDTPHEMTNAVPGVDTSNPPQADLSPLESHRIQPVSPYAAIDAISNRNFDANDSEPLDLTEEPILVRDEPSSKESSSPYSDSPGGIDDDDLLPMGNEDANELLTSTEPPNFLTQSIYIPTNSFEDALQPVRNDNSNNDEFPSHTSESIEKASAQETAPQRQLAGVAPWKPNEDEEFMLLGDLSTLTQTSTDIGASQFDNTVLEVAATEVTHLESSLEEQSSSLNANKEDVDKTEPHETSSSAVIVTQGEATDISASAPSAGENVASSVLDDPVEVEVEEEEEDEDLAAQFETNLDHIPDPIPVLRTIPQELKAPESTSSSVDVSPEVTSKTMADPVVSTSACNPCKTSVSDLLHWRDLKKSGIAFVAGLVVLLSLACCSIISVISYVALLALSGSLSFRVYKSVLQAVQKTNEGHPFKEYLDVDITPSSDKIHQIAESLIQHANPILQKARSIFLVEDIVDSIKFVVLFWVLTYIGSWFNGLTLLILAYLGAFSLPKAYEMNKAQVDQVLQLACAQVQEIVANVKAAIPFPGKKEKGQ